MPAVFRTNNRILPANARAADVAEKAVAEIIPVQQRRYYDAFRVQGIECIAYTRLKQGRRCSCTSSGKVISGVLNEEGKADAGTINQLITGNMNFEVNPYSMGYGNDPTQSSPFATGNKHQGVFDRVAPNGASNPEQPFARILPDDQDAFGDDGPLQHVDLDDLLGDVDVTTFGHSDAACCVCFGTRFIGGFSAFHSHRHVLPVQDLALVDGSLDLVQKPLVARACTGFSQKVVLPRGALAVDSMKVYNGFKPLAVVWSVDGTQITHENQVLAYCDGMPHLLAATFSLGVQDFTHVELQFTTSGESLYFEFPKRPSSTDTSLLERMEPFQVVLSPNIQQLDDQDVIVESQLGKVLIVQNVNPWHSRQLNVLGPECQVRVIQPMEAFRTLPPKGKITVQPATRMVRDNVNGWYRT